MSSNDLTLANKYQQKTDKQHILDNPDTYIGSVENVDASMWVFDEVTQQIIGVALVKIHALGDMRVAQNASQFLAHGRGADPADTRLRQGLAQRLGGGVGEEK